MGENAFELELKSPEHDRWLLLDVVGVYFDDWSQEEDGGVKVRDATEERLDLFLEAAGKGGLDVSYKVTRPKAEEVVGSNWILFLLMLLLGFSSGFYCAMIWTAIR